MESLNINILGISEIKWTGMGEFNKDDHLSTTVGKNLLEEIDKKTVNKRVWNMVPGLNLKNYRMILIHFQGKQFNIKVIQVYSPTTDTEEAEVELFYEDLQYLLELIPEKDVCFNIGVGMQE